MTKQAISISSLLTRQEAEECKLAFDKRDTNSSGTVNLKDLRSILSEVSQLPPDDELFSLVLKLNLDTSGTISFSQYIRLIEMHKEKQHGNLDDSETLEAFVICGGNADKTGTIETRKISKVIHAFGLTIDIDAILGELDKQRTGTIDYYKFSSIFSQQPNRQQKRHPTGPPRLGRNPSMGQFRLNRGASFAKS